MTMAKIFGLPTEMTLVFFATILAGSLGAIHYVIFHILLKRPFPDEVETAPGTGGAGEAVAAGRTGNETNSAGAQ
jgi:hypothetical protein